MGLMLAQNNLEVLLDIYYTINTILLSPIKEIIITLAVVGNELTFRDISYHLFGCGF